MKKLIRKKDWIVLLLAAIVLGLVVAIRYYSIIKPSLIEADDQILAVEIEKIVKTNSELKNQISNLTQKNQNYKESISDKNKLESQINKELSELRVINSEAEIRGQGVEIELNGRLFESQMIDLINAIKNIGCDAIAVNNNRFDLYSPVDISKYGQPIKIQIVGNSSLISSALSRKGGIIEQLKNKSIDVKIEKIDNLILPKAEENNFIYL